MKDDSLCIHLRDKSLIAKIRGITSDGKTISYKDFGTMVFEEYFSNRIMQLKSIGIDKLAEYTLQLENERK